MVAAVVGGVTPALGASGTTAGLAYVTGGSRGPERVWLANATGGAARKLGTGGFPSLSPSGAMVAVAGNTGASDVVVYSATGALIGKFFSTKQVTAAGALAWSPDSRYLAVGLSDANNFKTIGKSGLAVIDTTTGTTTMVAHGMIAGISWAPNTDTIVYGFSGSPKFGAPVDLYTTSASGTGTQRLTHDGRSQTPVWGKRGIVYDRTRGRGKDRAPVFQIYLLSGGHSTQITHTRPAPLLDGLVPVAVSADGTRLAAEFEGEDTGIAYSVNLVTHRVKELLVKRETVTCWGISKNGKRVLVDFGGFENPASAGTVETVPFGGGKPTVLVRHADFPSWNQ
jgi:WD40 repeat protein